MSRIIALIALCLLPFISLGCEKVPLLAPTGSTIFLTLGETTNLGLNSTVQVTAVVTEQGGTPPHNGTVVTFTTSLGSVNPIEARTTNGIASTTFNTGNRSGTATLRAFSGGAGTGESTAEASVNIGGAAEGITISLRTEGSASGGTATGIVAAVLDGDGNSVAGLPVTFSVDHGQVSPGVVVTDGNGESRTTVTTAETTVVTARGAGATSDTITIEPPGSFDLVVTSPAAGTAAEVGQVVTFTLTPAGESIFNEVIVDFGDGTPQVNIGRVAAARTVTHPYSQRGTYTVIARGTSPTGAIATAFTVVVVNDRAAIGVALTATPNPVTVTAGQGLVTLLATPTFPTGTALARVDWTFGDGTTDNNSTQLSRVHRYPGLGTFEARVVITATDGRQGSASISVRVIAP